MKQIGTDRRTLSVSMACAAGLGAMASSRAGGARARQRNRPEPVLSADRFRAYIDHFNANDEELYTGAFPNATAWDMLKANIPLLDCPDGDIERVYYFRWWTYRKHIAMTPDGYVITEFLPKVGWAGRNNTISCAAALHYYEGRWLHDRRFLDDYTRLWLRTDAQVRSYSFWIADAVWNRYLVTGDQSTITEFYPDLIRNYQAWESDHLDPNGMFWQIDDRDGMEEPIGSNNNKPAYRPTINSYMYADARAIAKMATLLGRSEDAREFNGKADKLKALVQTVLWDKRDQFFKYLPKKSGAVLSTGRELIGYTPWYVNLPDHGFEAAWAQVKDPRGFDAPWGITTAEQRDPDFRISYEGHECKWNGPVWPFATAVTLTAMANLLNNYRQNVLTKADYFRALKTYAFSHRRKRDDGSVVSWIDEDQNPYTGEWIARRILQDAGSPPRERGKDYNHSTFNDLIVTGLIGLRPGEDGGIHVNPLVPSSWNYFCLDNLPWQGKILTIFFDKTGKRYGRGRGLHVLMDGVDVPFTSAWAGSGTS